MWRSSAFLCESLFEWMRIWAVEAEKSSIIWLVSWFPNNCRLKYFRINREISQPRQNFMCEFFRYCQQTVFIQITQFSRFLRNCFNFANELLGIFQKKYFFIKLYRIQSSHLGPSELFMRCDSPNWGTTVVQWWWNF